MNIYLLTVNRLKSSPILDLYTTYINRLNWKINLKEIDLKNSASLSPPERTKKESLLLENSLPLNSFKILLDDEGTQFSSPAFSSYLNTLQVKGWSQVCFIIGGSDGINESLKSKMDFILSFGSPTWPHLLVRVLLVEQLYRAQQILKGHPYHH